MLGRGHIPDRGSKQVAAPTRDSSDVLCSSSLATVAEAGIRQRRQAPTGYQRDPDTRRLVPDDRTAGLVRWAFSARAAGTVPVVEIADCLGMTNSGTRYLLANRVYLGELIVGPYTNPAAHPPLVDARTFEAAQRSVARPPRRRREPALLAGLVRCASCGHRMTRGGSARLSVYGCPKHHSGAHCPAPAAVTLALLDAHVERIALAELARLSVLAGANTGLERAQDEVTAAHAALDAYVEAVSAVEIGVEAFAAGARQRRTRLEQARDELRPRWPSSRRSASRRAGLRSGARSPPESATRCYAACCEP
jgi:hypothetical protein